MLANMIDDNVTPEVKDEEFLSFFEKRILKERKKKSRHRLYFDLIITALVVFVLFSVVAGLAVVQGDSMKPNLTDGIVALFYRLDKSYEVNDVVIFYPDGEAQLLIKRIVAIAGDVVDINDTTGKLMVNNVIQDNDTILGKTEARDGGVTFPYTVPEGSVFVMGDNREVAMDSRDFGAVETNKLMGKVVFEIKVVNG